MLPANPASIVESAEAGQLPALIAEWEDAAATDERHWLARALRVDLALLTARPELALVALARRLLWVSDWFAHAPPVSPACARASELAARWLAAGGSPHLRALRPPAVPLGGGVREEYRTSLRGELCVAAEGAHVGVIGDGATIGWERASGRRTNAAMLARRAPAAWGIGVARARDQIALASTVDARERVVTLAAGREAAVCAIHDLGGDRVLVELADDGAPRDFDGEGERHVALVDAAAARVVWIVAGRVGAAALAPGGHVIRGDRWRLTIHDARSGETRASWPGPAVEAVACASDGTIVTRSGDVIRVWSAEARGAVTSGDRGWAEAELSPNGERLVTGGDLSDGRTGAHIARLDVGLRAPEPRSPARALTDAGLVELSVRGLRMWRARDGQLVLDERDRTAWYDDVVAIDPRGRTYAIGSRTSGTLQVADLRSGEPSLAGRVRLAQGAALGYTADGESIWWHEASGARRVAPANGTGVARLLADDEPTPRIPPPRTIAVVDGVLQLGALAAPCDDPEVVVSPDGQALAGRASHYLCER